MMESQLDRVEAKLDRLIDAMPVLQALGDLLVEADYVTKVKGLNKNTISQNEKLEKFNGIGQRKLLVTLKSVAVVKNRKRPR